MCTLRSVLTVTHSLGYYWNTTQVVPVVGFWKVTRCWYFDSAGCLSRNSSPVPVSKAHILFFYQNWIMLSKSLACNKCDDLCITNISHRCNKILQHPIHSKNSTTKSLFIAWQQCVKKTLIFWMYRIQSFSSLVIRTHISIHMNVLQTKMRFFNLNLSFSNKLLKNL